MEKYLKHFKTDIRVWRGEAISKTSCRSDSPGLNILRAAAVRIAQRKAKRPAGGLVLPALMPFSFFKEQMGRYRSYVFNLLQPNFVYACSDIKTAA